jgi:23S rRNA (pseudouridine1915-N3)-methyltransferase
MPALHLTILAIGKLKERYWRDACDEYAKRLQPYCKLQVSEFNDVDPAKAGGDVRARAQEATSLERALPQGSYTIALDREGREASSEDLAVLIRKLTQQTSHIAFLIGGPTGLDASLLQRADARLSFGPLTLPHNLARVVLFEQLYRAAKINAGEPYHR